MSSMFFFCPNCRQMSTFIISFFSYMSSLSKKNEKKFSKSDSKHPKNYLHLWRGFFNNHSLPEWGLTKLIIPWKERKLFSMILMNKMLPDCTDMTKADNRIIDSTTANSSHYNKTISENHLEEISPQSKVLCRGDWGLCHQQAKVQMSDICPACNFSFHCFIKIAERRFLQMLINPCVQPGGCNFSL